MEPIRHYNPASDDLRYLFGEQEPLAEVPPGQLIRVDTQDCFGGAARSVADLPSKVCRFPHLNPIAGPFHVTGAQPGDTLAVHILSINPTRAHGFSATFPHFGALTGTAATAMLHPPLPERVWRYDFDRTAGTVRYEARNSDLVVDLPMEPMLGTIGVAPPAGEARMTITADTHGGNLDTRHVRPGNTIYLPVYVEGALFGIGDGHARQGDGELCGVAVEAAMSTLLVVDVIKGANTPTPRIESDTALMSVGSARPLEDAYRSAHRDLVGWVCEITGADLLDAYQLVAQAGTTSVANVVNPNYTMVASVEKLFVPGRTAFGGMHQRLRKLAAAHR